MRGIVYENDDIGLVSKYVGSGYRTHLLLYVNGEKVCTDAARPDQTLLDFLRMDLGLTGSKLGCAEGGCGACTVMISRYDYKTDTILHYGVNACLMPVCAADGCHVTTVEGIGQSLNDTLHPIQKRMTEFHGSQCGFCTPGIIVAMYSLFANHTDVQHIEEHLDGNLCRCTGYRPIWDAAKSLCSEEIHGPCGMECKNCPTRHDCDMPCNTRHEEMDEEPTNCDGTWRQFKTSTVSKCQSKLPLKDLKSTTGDLYIDQPNNMFPEALKFYLSRPSSLLVVRNNATWFAPNSLTELLELKDEFPSAKIVVGATEVGIETKFKNSVYPKLIYPSHYIEELLTFECQHEKLLIGACLPLSNIQQECLRLVKSSPIDGKNRTPKAIHDMLRWFASTQIRNAACIGGNLATASPISDMNPMLAALGASLELQSLKGGTRFVKVSDFFISYRKVDLQPCEVIVKIHVPLTQDYFEYVLPFKQARRREDDISIVTAGIQVKVKPEGNLFVIEQATIAFGGMAPKTVMCPKTSAALVGETWSAKTFTIARRTVMDELLLPENVPGGQVEYRRTLAASFLFKFYLSTSLSISQDLKRLNEFVRIGKKLPNGYPINLPNPVTVCEDEISGADQFVTSAKPSISGTQVYPFPKVTSGLEDRAADSLSLSKKASSKVDKLGIPASHASGELHCSGEAIYVDDIPKPEKMLHASLVISDRCNVRLKSTNKKKALEIPGVVNIFFYNDLAALGGSNKLGPIVKDEEIFVTEEVRHVGAVIGIAVADTLDAANAASRAVEITYEDILDDQGNIVKPIVSIQEAIEADSFYDFTQHTLEMGNIEKTLEDSSDQNQTTVTVTGEFSCGGQEHFYLETNTTLVVPSEGGLKIYASTQAPTKTQFFCATATNTPASKVVCHVKRMGGGFGGKETRSVFASAAAAVAAKVTLRPVRLTLDRNVDMAITGQRHAFYAKYKANATFNPNDLSKAAKLGGLDVQIYSNGGCALDLSLPVLDRCLFHIDNSYKWQAIRAAGVVCKTNQPPHTAFRGFGGPQGLAICETVIDHLLQLLPTTINADSFRRENMYQEGDYVPFGMRLENWTVPKAWDNLYTIANVEDRRKEIINFNAKHRWKKRGLALLPVKFGIAFTAKFMNQGGALVHLYQDGTVLISHGGTEMGQGLHTKCAQVAAHAFGIPLSSVYIDDTSTDKVANTNPTAASQGTDLYGMATLNACFEILENIKPIREKMGPDATLAEIATAAFFERIDLTAHGFFKLADDRCGYDWDAPKPTDPELLKLPDNSFRGHAFNYFTQGVAVSEVEIDVLTGNHRNLRSDVMMDVGSSINPAIDIGQIEGAFVQGIGWCTLEEVTWGDQEHTWVQPPGRLFTQGPGTYKIPAFNDCPETFNITLMDTENPFAVHSSRAVGEPPFFLGATIAFAIKDAIRATRTSELESCKSSVPPSIFRMNFPVTSERIRMLCCDTICQEGINHDSENMSGVGIERVLNYHPKGSY